MLRDLVATDDLALDVGHADGQAVAGGPVRLVQIPALEPFPIYVAHEERDPAGLVGSAALNAALGEVCPRPPDRAAIESVHRHRGLEGIDVRLGDQQPQLRAGRVLGRMVQLAQDLRDPGAGADDRGLHRRRP